MGVPSNPLSHDAFVPPPRLFALMLCVLLGASPTLAQDLIELPIDLPILDDVRLLEAVADVPQTERVQARLAGLETESRAFTHRLTVAR